MDIVKKKTGRRFWIVAMVALVAILVSVGCKDQTASQDEKPWEAEKCEDGTDVIVEIGGIELSLPRSRELMWRDKNGEQYRNDNIDWHPSEDCSTKRLDDVASVNFGIGLVECIPEKPNTCKTIYQRYKNTIDQREKEGELTALPSGIVMSKRDFLYMLPVEQAPTGNQEPVTISCTALQSEPTKFDHCNVGYMHPDGLRFGYQFQRIKYPVDEYVNVDRIYREIYESKKLSNKVKETVSEEEQP